MLYRCMRLIICASASLLILSGCSDQAMVPATTSATPVSAHLETFVGAQTCPGVELLGVQVEITDEVRGFIVNPDQPGRSIDSRVFVMVWPSGYSLEDRGVVNDQGRVVATNGGVLRAPQVCLEAQRMLMVALEALPTAS